MYDVWSLFLLYAFVSSKHEELKESFQKVSDTSHSNFVCHVASEFLLWLTVLKNGNDDCPKCCAMYIRMTKYVFTFIDLFCCVNAIGIETGYELFVVVWRDLCQHRHKA